MNRKQMVVANVRYKSSRGKGAAQLKGLLRYYQYRDDRDGHIPQDFGLERWVDHGLGNNHATIAANCEALKSKHVQAFTWVINPNPVLIKLLPEQQRMQFVRELTEATIETFFEQRDIETPEWSYAIHRRVTKDEDQPGRDNPHTHVILPGTYYSWADGDRLPLYMNRSQPDNHIELLHQVAEQQTERLMERYLGRDWEQQVDTLLEQQEIAQQSQPTPEPESDIAPELPNPFEDTETTLDQLVDLDTLGNPHLVIERDGNALGFWILTRPDIFDDNHADVLLLNYSSQSGASLASVVTELPAQQADRFADHLIDLMDDEGEAGLHKLFAYHDQLQESADQVQTVQQILDAHQRDKGVSGWSVDIDF